MPDDGNGMLMWPAAEFRGEVVLSFTRPIESTGAKLRREGVRVLEDVKQFVIKQFVIVAKEIKRFLHNLFIFPEACHTLPAHYYDMAMRINPQMRMTLLFDTFTVSPGNVERLKPLHELRVTYTVMMDAFT